VDLSHPIRSVIPSLDGAVIEALASTRDRMSGREVQRLAGTGSVRGVQLVLARLVDEGLVLAERHPGTILYEANRAHLAWPAIEWMVGLRRILFESICEQVGGWPVAPLHVSLVGEAARKEAAAPRGGRGPTEIQLVIVRPARPEGGLVAWDARVETLRGSIAGWTGHPCRVHSIDRAGIADRRAAADRELDAWVKDGRLLVGDPLPALFGR
jgi:hypothetical protein